MFFEDWELKIFKNIYQAIHPHHEDVNQIQESWIIFHLISIISRAPKLFT